MGLKILVYRLINDEWYLRQVVNTTNFIPISCLKMTKNEKYASNLLCF